MKIISLLLIITTLASCTSLAPRRGPASEARAEYPLIRHADISKEEGQRYGAWVTLLLSRANCKTIDEAVKGELEVVHCAFRMPFPIEGPLEIEFSSATRSFINLGVLPFERHGKVLGVSVIGSLKKSVFTGEEKFSGFLRWKGAPPHNYTNP